MVYGLCCNSGPSAAQTQSYVSLSPNVLQGSPVGMLAASTFPMLFGTTSSGLLPRRFLAMLLLPLPTTSHAWNHCYHKVNLLVKSSKNPAPLFRASIVDVHCERL